MPLCPLARAALCAAATTALTALPAAASVELLDASALFYHFGSARTADDYISHTDVASTTSPIGYDDGLLAYSVSSALIPATSISGGSTLLTLSAVHTIMASVDASITGGYAHAGAGLSSFELALRITTTPFLYTGELTLQPYEGPEFPSGSIIPPGDYLFAHFIGPFTIDASASALPGQTTLVEDGRTFSFNFTPIPAPAAAATLALGLAATQRRRRAL